LTGYVFLFDQRLNRFTDWRGYYRLSTRNDATTLFDPGGSPCASPQIIKFRPPDATMPHNFYSFDARRMEEVGALDADTMRGNSANSEILVKAASPAADDDSFKDLDSLARAFDDPCVHPYGISGSKVGNVVPVLL